MAMLRRYGRIWWLYANSCLMREMGFRASFYLGVLRNLLWLSLSLVSIEVIFYHTDAIAGWTRPQMWLILGVARLGQSVIGFLFQNNMHAISGYIMRGQMDYILLLPISSQFTATMRYIRVHSLPIALINLGLIVYAASQLDTEPEAGQVGAAMILFSAGLVMIYALWLSLATLSFWLIRQAPNIAELFDTLYQAGYYPREIHSQALQFIITYIVPVAYVTILPAEAMTGGLDVRALALAIPLAALTFFLSSRFWILGTRSYTSASS
jgi:ABC-2 type transport system permease protein